MSITRVFNYKVGADGRVTCNGSRRPQLVGVQGDNGVSILNFDLSDIFSDNAHYFFEIVTGQRTPFILSDESEEVSFNEEILSLSLTNEITAEGGRVEIRIVEEALDEELGEAIEGSTYITYVLLEMKDGTIPKLGNKAYGIFLEMKDYFDKSYDEVKKGLTEIREIREDFNNSNIGSLDQRITSNENAIENINDELSGYSQKNAEQDETLASHSDFIGELFTNLYNHNIDTSAHNDIREVIKGLSDRINALHDCDDTTLDQTKEIVAYIKENRSILEGVTTSKVNVADIIDNLITNVSDKPLSAAQGVELKRLIDAVKIPAKLSELSNDAGFVDDDYVSNAVESVNLPRDIRVKNYDSNSVTVAFETGTGSSQECVYDVDLTGDGKYEVFLYKFVDDGEYHYTLSQEGGEPDGCEGRVYAFTYKVTNGELHYIAVGSGVLLNKLVTIESITADGTAGTYNFSNLNLDYFLINISSLKGAPSNQSYRVCINGNTSKIVAYLNNMVHTTNNTNAFVRVDLNNVQSLKGLGTDPSGIAATESKTASEYLEEVSKITSITIAPYNENVLIQNGSTITLKGREVQ